MSHPSLRRALFGAVAVAAAVVVAGPAFAQRTKLTVYTALENDQVGPYKAAFEAAVKDVEIAWVRDSTGVVTARFLAEKDNPRADVIWGLGASSIALFDSMGLLEPYTPKGTDALKPAFKSGKTPVAWTGMDAWLAVICYNTVEGKKKNIPAPTSWADLTKSVYKNEIVMPNPASSGTGYLMVSGWIQMMGEDKAWAFMDRLHQNIAAYSHSGSKPCEQAAAGEYAVGLSLPLRGARLKEQGAPLELVIPKEGTGWEMQVAGILKGAKNLADARTFMDWTVSQGAMEAYGRRAEVTAYEVKVPKSEHLPADLAQRMIKNDFAWAAKNQQRVIAEWRKRYDAKTEPKK